MERHATTQTLRDAAAGNREAADRLVPVIYTELQRLARRELSKERQGHTLDSVALVNEAYVKLIDADGADWRDRAHFVALCVRAMRQVLVDHARRHNAAKRGYGLCIHTRNLNGVQRGTSPLEVVTLEDVLERLGRVNRDALQLVELCGYGGLELKEAAGHLGLSYSTARRRWAFAKAWLARELGGPLA